MWYAVHKCYCVGHIVYGRVLGFILDDDPALGGLESDTPLAKETEEEIREVLRDHPLEIAGQLEYIEIP